LIVSRKVHAEVIDNVIHYANVSNESSSTVMDVENQGGGDAEASNPQSSKTAAWLNNNSKLNFFYTNAQSICNKIKELQGFIYGTSIDIIAITETWLSSDYWDNEILPKGYTIFRKDRNSHGGGILLAVSNDIPSN